MSLPTREWMMEKINADPDEGPIGVLPANLHRLTTNEVTYLQSILRMLRSDMLRIRSGPTLYTEAISDNCNWLEMFIDSAAPAYDTAALEARYREGEEDGYSKGVTDLRDDLLVDLSAANPKSVAEAIQIVSDGMPEPRSDWRLNGNRPLSFDRETGGRLVREAWVRWAELQPSPKPSWLVPYDQLSEEDKEADRQIAETMGRWTLLLDASAHAIKS